MSEPTRIEKAPDAFRTISEVSETLDVPQHVLRFWEAKFNQVKPLKRAGGRRYYRPEDVEPNPVTGKVYAVNMVQPFAARTAAAVALIVGVGPEPSKQFAPLP